jgi:hypothetical protein
MGPFLVGPISPEAFLNSFLPPPLVPLDPPFVAGMFKPYIDLLPKPGKQEKSEPENKYYNVFVSSDPYRPALTVLVLGSNIPFPD